MSTSIERINEAMHRTCQARDRIQNRSADAIVHALAQAAKNWLSLGSSWRKKAVDQAPAATGFSREMVNQAIDLTFGAITAEALRELLNKSVASWERRSRRDRPELIAHFLAGNVPAPAIGSICYGLLLKSANLVKVANRDPVFPVLFVESLREVDAELADCVAVLDWRREEIALTKTALSEADTVIAFGDDETIEALRQMTRPDAHFLGYGHKLSFAVIAKEALTKETLLQLAEAAAFDASVYDQQGCLSPHAFYIEEGGQISPREFAEALAGAMAAYQTRVPRGQLSVEEAAQIAKLRGAYEFRCASDRTVAVWTGADDISQSKNGGVGLCACLNETPQAGTPVPPQTHGMAANAWLVIYEEDPMFTPSCLNRVVFVKPIKKLESIPQLMQRFASNLSTVGLAPMTERTHTFMTELAKIGVKRVCPVGQMQRPPLSLSP